MHSIFIWGIKIIGWDKSSVYIDLKQPYEWYFLNRISYIFAIAIINFRLFIIFNFRLFFMCDKTLKNIGEVKEIINSVAKDDMDSQTLDAKLVHMGQKLNRLKQQILSTDRKHRQEIEKKNKEVNKYL